MLLFQNGYLRAPTAELKHDQTDQDKLPPYDILDDILERYIEKDEEPTEIIKGDMIKKWLMMLFA